MTVISRDVLCCRYFAQLPYVHPGATNSLKFYSGCCYPILSTYFIYEVLLVITTHIALTVK